MGAKTAGNISNSLRGHAVLERRFLDEDVGGVAGLGRLAHGEIALVAGDVGELGAGHFRFGQVVHDFDAGRGKGGPLRRELEGEADLGDLIAERNALEEIGRDGWWTWNGKRGVVDVVRRGRWFGGGWLGSRSDRLRDGNGLKWRRRVG